MSTKVYRNIKEFMKRDNKEDNGVSFEFSKRIYNWESMNNTNAGCWDCYNCFNCVRCTDCINLRSCSECYYCAFLNHQSSRSIASHRPEAFVL